MLRNVWLFQKISIGSKYCFFAECQNSIPFKSYYNFNVGNLVGTLIDLDFRFEETYLGRAQK